MKTVHISTALLSTLLVFQRVSAQADEILNMVSPCAVSRLWA
jgi:hypothetical protein